MPRLWGTPLGFHRLPSHVSNPWWPQQATQHIKITECLKKFIIDSPALVFLAKKEYTPRYTPNGWWSPIAAACRISGALTTVMTVALGDAVRVESVVFMLCVCVEHGLGKKQKDLV